MIVKIEKKYEKTSILLSAASKLKLCPNPEKKLTTDYLERLMNAHS